MNRPASPGPGAARERTPRAQLPLLDRLLDAGEGDDAVPSAAQALERLHAAVLRDLDALLNARRRWRAPPPLLAELGASLLGYGIPDPASGAYSVPELRAALADEVAATIRRFEPRLTQVAVTLVDGTDPLDGTLRLKVDAVLRADPVPEPVSFETLLEPVSREVTLRAK